MTKATTPPTPTSREPDAGVAFDPKRPAWTRDGREVQNLHDDPTRPEERWIGRVAGEDQLRFWIKPSGLGKGSSALDLTNVPPPSTPEPADAGQVEGDAAFQALCDGYRVEAQTDEALYVENPRFQEDDGSAPRLRLARDHLARRGASLPVSSAPQVDAREGVELVAWRSIETVPEDGTWIIGGDGDEAWRCHFVPYPADHPEFTGGEWFTSNRTMVEIDRWMPDPDTAPPPRPDPATDGGWRAASKIISEYSGLTQDQKFYLFRELHHAQFPAEQKGGGCMCNPSGNDGLTCPDENGVPLCCKAAPPEPVSPKPSAPAYETAMGDAGAAYIRSVTLNNSDACLGGLFRYQELYEKMVAASTQLPADTPPTDPDATGGAGDATGLVEHIRVLEDRIRILQDELRRRHEVETDQVWFWQGDQSDHLESLTCQVVITAADLRNIVSGVQVNPAPSPHSATDALRKIAALRHSLPREMVNRDAYELQDLLHQRIIGIFDLADAALAGGWQDLSAPAVGEDEVEKGSVVLVTDVW